MYTSNLSYSRKSHDQLMFLPAIRSTKTNTLTLNNIVTDQMSLGCHMMIIFHLQLSTVKPSECLLLFPQIHPHTIHTECASQLKQCQCVLWLSAMAGLVFISH